MNTEKRIPLALLMLRIGIFIVMLFWTIDKFVRPDHALTVYKYFYFIGGLGKNLIYVIGGVELLLMIGFLVGFKKRLTYGLVMILHAISTISSYKQYLDPYADGPNLLFFAAWPMLAACFALYYLRDLDTLGVIDKKTA